MPSSSISINTRQILTLDGEDYVYCSLELLEKALDIGYDLHRLPISLKILLEGLLRHEREGHVTATQIEELAGWGRNREATVEFPFFPARVLMQDFTGVPALVDLAAMRDALVALGGDPDQINPRIPVDLVIDHSIVVDAFGDKKSLDQNLALEFKRNHERYQFLKWGQKAFQHFRVIPPGHGICHQVNLEYLAPGLVVGPDNFIFPDTVIGTDSHTTMINALGVLGWGVGGIEAEAAMLGQPLSLVSPKVLGVHLSGKLPDGTLATDLVLTLTHLLRERGVVNHFVEFFGEGLDTLSLPDRATVANMAPEFGATCAFFPIDASTLEYLKITGRSPKRVALLEAYAKTQGLWRTVEEPFFTDTLEVNLSKIFPTLAGPKRPQDSVLLSDVARAAASLSSDQKTETSEKDPVCAGDIVIAAITSCTNTSNPHALITAGLLAQKAVARDLKVKPWVKTSLAPGSQTVTTYLKKLELEPALEALGFYTVGYGCTTCIGNSGPLSEAIANVIKQKDLSVAAVLSGNRNFESRIHPLVKLNYLASPPLVVAYAIAGNLSVNLTKDPLGTDSKGQPVFLHEIWPSAKEVQKALDSAIDATLFPKTYKHATEGSPAWKKLTIPSSHVYHWDTKSTYIRKPPFFDNFTLEKPVLLDVKQAHILAIFGDSMTTDHISPAGSISSRSPAGLYLASLDIKPENFSSYGARRGNHEVMVRGTFANPRIQNEMVPDQQGGYTFHIPTSKKMTIFEASGHYQKENTPLIVFAGKEYGTGSSRDWAAKGPLLLGVRAVVAESFERIHRSNLVGMGILPLRFIEGMTRHDLELKGNEAIDILGVFSDLDVEATLTLHIHRNQQNRLLVPVTCCLETAEEVTFFKNGGILPTILRRVKEGKK